MKTLTVSSKGQIAIPKEIRAILHIKEGDKLLFDIKNGKLILEPVINVPRSQAWFWSEDIQNQIAQSEDNFKKGDYKRFDIDDLIKELDE